MRGMNKKILISLLTTLVVFITVFATTYAWVGIFTYANTDSFKMNLKVQDLDSNYFLTISSSGEPGTFSNEVPAIELQRQIVNNRYNDRYIDAVDESIERIFNDITLAPTTTSILTNNTFATFKAVDYNKSELEFYDSIDYYKFDLYLSVDTKEGIDSNTTGIKSSVYLENIEETLIGSISRGIFGNINPYFDLPSDSEYAILKEIPQMFQVNSKNAVRFGLSIYDPLNINDEYSNELPFESKIFQGGNQAPSYDNNTDTYDLGGCLPFDYNTAINELLIVRPNYRSASSRSLFDQSLNVATNRNDLELTDNNRMLWNKRDETNYLGCMVGIQTKMKITVYFWFEGWDADCLKAIEKQPVTLNLTFTSGTDD